MNTSVAFWKDAVNQQANAEDARLILVEATEAIPSSAELWIALARLETTHQQAKKVLNKARHEIPTSYEIWVAALKLQERMGDTNQVDIMRRAVQSLTQACVMQLSWERLVTAWTKTMIGRNCGCMMHDRASHEGSTKQREPSPPTPCEFLPIESPYGWLRPTWKSTKDPTKPCGSYWRTEDAVKACPHSQSEVLEVGNIYDPRHN